MKLKQIIQYTVLAIIVLFPIFHKLGLDTIRDWDESRLACNALEMSENGNYIVTHFENQPDLWNTKPPLMIWLQVASCKIFGFNEIGIRIPSAIAALLTALCLLLFCLHFLKNKLWGFIAVIILVTSPGYISTHITRTGDYDALLTLFTTIYCLAFYLFLESEWKKKNIFLLISFAGITFAVMTKGVAGLFYIPILFLYTLFRKKLFTTLKNPFFYFGLLFFILFVGGFYFLREMSSPGFLKAVYENELGGRFLNTVEMHKIGRAHV